MQSFELTPEQVTGVVALLGPDASGLSYVDGLLQVDEIAPLVAAMDPANLHKAALADYARLARKRAEISGIVVGGATIQTDEASQAKIIGAYVAASRNPAWETLWESVHPVDATQMIAIGDAVQAHINGTFITRAAVLADIETGTLTTTAEIDDRFGLPSQQQD